MFNSEVDVGPSLPAILLQTAGVFVFLIVVGLLTFWIPVALSEIDSPIAVIPEAIAVLAYAGGVPYALARWVARNYPALVAAGRVVGVFPAIVFIPLAIWTKGLLLAPRVQGPEGMVWIVIIFGTYPALGAIGYSLGMISAGDKGTAS